VISILDLKGHAGIPHDADDDLLEAYEAAAVAAFQHDSGKYVGPPEAVTEYLNVNRPERVLLLKDPALAEDLSVSPNILAPIVETVSSGDDYDIADEADYVVEGDRVIHLTGFWPWGFRAVRVTYWRGYAADTEPADVRQAVREIVAHMYEHREAVTDLNLNEVPMGARQTIQRYRKVRA
jgi:hypothetical protein